tara:strand:- start:129 stop:566 length:438 start_codon:yes stop_codon:yes gene_type:complete
MVGFCSIEDAFPGFTTKEKKSKSNSDMSNDNIKLSRRIRELEKRELIKPEKSVGNPIDDEVNEINKKLFDDLDNKYREIVDKLTDEIKFLKHELFDKKGEKKDIIEGFTLDIQNDQFNELMLYVCTCIFFIFLFDYMFSFGKRSY